MFSTQISDIKDCMSKLLTGEAFDSFYLVEAVILMGISYQLDGHLNRSFYDSEQTPSRDFCLWKEARPVVFQIIKGKRQPLGLKIILAFPDNALEWFIKESRCPFSREDIEGIYVNIHFESGSLRITSGISYRVFSTDRRLEQCVDDHLAAYLLSRGIS